MTIEEDAQPTQPVAPIKQPLLQGCQHLHTKEVPAPAPHHLQLVCAACQGHIRYLADPATLALRRQTAIKIEKLLLILPVTEGWEALFIKKASLSRQGKLSPRQQLVLDEIYARYFPKGQS